MEKKMENDLEIYRYNEQISFRKCSLFGNHKVNFGDRTIKQEYDNN